MKTKLAKELQELETELSAVRKEHAKNLANVRKWREGYRISLSWASESRRDIARGKRLIAELRRRMGVGT